MVEELEQAFHSKQDGIISTEVLSGDDENAFTMIQHWESKELAHAASRRMVQSEETLAFRNAVDPKHVKLRFFEQLGTWK